MAGEMFGAPNGLDAWADNERRNIKSNVDQMESLGRIAAQPIARRKLEAEAKLAETEVEQNEAFAALVTGQANSPTGDRAPATPINMADRLDKLAEAAAGAGLVDKAGKLAHQASQIRSQAQTALNQQAQAKVKELELITRTADLQGQVFGDVKDEADWQRANAVFTLQSGKPSPYLGVPFSPALVERIRSNAFTAAERARLMADETKQEALEAYRKSTLAQGNARIDLERERVRIAEDRAKREEKNGKAPVAPSKEEREEAARLMRLGGIETDGIDIDAMDSMAFELAARGRALQRKNPALSVQEGVQQAFNQAMANGELETDDGGGTSFLGMTFGGKPKKFNKVEKPKPITTPLPAQAVSQLKEGMQTTFKNGQVWTLKGGKPVKVN